MMIAEPDKQCLMKRIKIQLSQYGGIYGKNTCIIEVDFAKFVKYDHATPIATSIVFQSK